MKQILLLALAIMLLSACSAPKYTYHFDHYDYNSGKKASTPALTEDAVVAQPASPTLTADISGKPADLPASHSLAAAEKRTEAAPLKKYTDMSKSEKKEFRKDVKKEFKAYVKAIKNGDGVDTSAETKVMDNDLKLAIIFGAVGLTLSLFAGVNEIFWILGVISIVVGLVFLIKWLVRQ